MTMVMRNTKTPKQSGRDSVVGMRTLKPTVKPSANKIALGIISREGKSVATKRLADKMLKVLKTADAILKVRDNELAMENPEIAALVNDPKLNATLIKLLQQLTSQAQGLIKSKEGAASDEGEEPFVPYATDAADVRRTIDAAQRKSAEDAKSSGDAAALHCDTTQNYIRKQFGQEPVSVEGDQLYALFEAN